jgi:tRNA A-37 threonylcarbamoyl transferase component Bud32
MGVVYEALDRRSHHRVALKILRKVDAQAVGRIKHEFRALAHVQHRNLVSLGELFEDHEQWFFTMELVDGQNFLSYVRGSEEPDPETPSGISVSADTMQDVHVDGGQGPKAFSEARLRGALAQLCVGLSVLHSLGKVHRDIKPSNLRVTSSGRVVLLDFGLVTDIAKDDLESAVGAVGTTAYMAPEQAKMAAVGPEADWYAVGVLLYEVLTGGLPFAGPPLQVMLRKQQAEPPSPKSCVDTVPDDLSRLCVRLLAVDPKDRPSAREVLDALGVDGETDLALSSTSSSLPQTLPFVGRTAELETLRAAFAEVQRGQASLVVIDGESGVGKTALVQKLTEELVDRWPQVLVLSGRCYERESVPYKIFDGAMDALCRYLRKLDPIDAALILGPDAALVGRLFPVFTRLTAVRRAAVREIHNPQELRRRAFAAVRDMLSRAAAQVPLVMCVDDVQWADADSVVLLSEILHPPHAPPLLVIFTRRQVETVSLALPLEGARILALGALARGESETLAALLCERFAKGASRADPRALAHEAEGHPLFLHELIRHVATTGTGVARLDEALLSRVDLLDPPARHLLEVLSVAGGPLPLPVAAQAAGQDATEAARSASLLRAGMLTRQASPRADAGLEPYHDRIQKAVAARLDAGARRRYHAQLADALLGADPARENARLLVLHLEAAGRTGEATDRAERAGELMAEALAFDQAAEFFRTALRLGHYEEARRRQILSNLGDALAHAGRCPEAADVFLAAADGAEASANLEYRRRAGEQLLISGYVERGLEVVRAVLLEAGLALPKSPRRALASLLLHRARLRLRGLSWAEKGEGEIAPREQQRLELHKTVALGLAFVDNIRGVEFQARGLLLALETGATVHVARSLGLESVYRASAGRAARAKTETLLCEARRIAETSKDPYLQGWALAASGAADCLAGYFGAAATQLRQAEVIFTQKIAGSTWEVNNTRVMLMLALRQMGAFKELEQRLEDCLRDAARRGDRFAATTLTRAINTVWIARDQPDVAERELCKKLWSPPETGFLHLQHWYELRARGELWLYRDHRGGAREAFQAPVRAVERSLLPRVQIVRADFAWIRARLLLSEAESPGDLEAVLRIARRLSHEPVPYARAWAELLLAGIAAKERRTAGAMAHLREAIPLCESEDLLLCLAAARLRLGQLIGGDEGQRLVTSAETWMRSERIVKPERMAAVVTPGFP